MIHVVRSGDTLSSIARRNGLPLSRLLALNPEIENADAILIGQRIRLNDPMNTTSVGAAATPNPTVAVTPAVSSVPAEELREGAEHTVVFGESLGVIALEHGMTLARILELNPDIEDPDLIEPGQILQLSTVVVDDEELPETVAATAVVPATTIHEVVPGDSLSAIASANRTTVAKILTLNPDIADPNAIHVGQRIRLPGGGAEPLPTLAASQPAPGGASNRFDRTKFFGAYRTEFAGRLNQSQVEGIEFLLSRLEADPEYRDLRDCAYLLATAKHEAANRWQPIAEFGDRARFDKLYDPVLASTQRRRRRNRRMGNTNQGDGFRYRGRGYVQITFKNNYRKMGNLLGVDLVSNPHKALDPDIAWGIIARGMKRGSFTGKRLSDFITPTRTDYVNARRIINGTDRAGPIASIATRFERILRSTS